MRQGTWISAPMATLAGWWIVYRDGLSLPTYQVNDEVAAGQLVQLLNEAEADEKYKGGDNDDGN